MRVQAACAAGLAAALCALSPAPAAADGARPPWIDAHPPAGWTVLPGLSRSVATTLRQSGALGDLSVDSGAEAYAEPGSGAFYLSWLVASAPSATPVDTVRGALDHVRAGRVHASPLAGSTEELRWEESLSDGVASATFEWRHLSNETLSLVRVLAWVSARGEPRVLKGECVLSTTAGAAAPAIEAPCRAALASLAVTATPADRGALSALPGAAPLPQPSVTGGGQDEAAAVAGGSSASPAKVLYAGAPAESGDWLSRWLVVLGGGLLAGAAAFAVHRRRGRGQPAARSSGEEDS